MAMRATLPPRDDLDEGSVGCSVGRAPGEELSWQRVGGSHTVTRSPYSRYARLACGAPRNGQLRISGTRDVADSAEGAGQDVITIGLVPVGAACAA